MLYAIFVGVGSQRDRRIPNAKNARVDTENLHRLISDTISDQRQLTLLVDDRAKKATIARIMTEELPTRVTRNDSLLFYFAGNVVKDPPAGQTDTSAFLVTHDVAMENVRGQSLDVVAELSTWMRRFTARVVTVVLDVAFIRGSQHIETPRNLQAVRVPTRPSPFPHSMEGPPSARPMRASVPSPLPASASRPPQSSKPMSSRSPSPLPSQSLIPSVWPRMAMGDRTVLIASDDGSFAAVANGESNRVGFTKELVDSLKAANGTSITPNLLHAQTSERVRTMSSRPPSLTGSGFPAHEPLFKMR